MVSKKLRQAARIERKPTIPESVRTSKKDEVAAWVDENAADDWQEWTFTEVAEETGFSRQHVSNTVQDYFRPAQQPVQRAQPRELERVDGVDGSQLSAEVVEVIADAVKQAYREGYRDAVQDHQQAE